MSHLMGFYVVNIAMQLAFSEIQSLLAAALEFSSSDQRLARRIEKGHGRDLTDDQLVLLHGIGQKQRHARASAIFDRKGNFKKDYKDAIRIQKLREQRLAAIREAAASNAPTQPPMPLYNEPLWNTRQNKYTVLINGIDPETTKEYEHLFRVNPNTVRMGERIKVPSNVDFRSRVTGGQELQKPIILPGYEERHQQAIDICKVAVVTYAGSGCSYMMFRVILDEFRRSWLNNPTSRRHFGKGELPDTITVFPTNQ